MVKAKDNSVFATWGECRKIPLEKYRRLVFYLIVEEKEDMTNIAAKSAVSNHAESEAAKDYFGSVSPIFEYWCLDCDEFFEVKELLAHCPKCNSSLKDNLVQIYMEHDPDPDIICSLKEFTAG